MKYTSVRFSNELQKLDFKFEHQDGQSNGHQWETACGLLLVNILCFMV